MSALAADREQIGRFVAALLRHADPGGFVSLRTFEHARGRPPVEIRTVRINGEGLEPVVAQAAGAATRAARHPRPAVFAPPVCTFATERRAAEANVRNGVALSVECDEEPEETRRRLEGLLGRATVVVASGGLWADPGTGQLQAKLHLHWRLAEPTRDAAAHAELRRAREIGVALAGGDPSAVPLAHPLRWPGSWHRKGEPRLCRIVALREDLEVDLADALDTLEQAAALALRHATAADADRLRAALKPRDGRWGDASLARDSDARDPDLEALADAIPNDDAPRAEYVAVGLGFHAASGGGTAGFNAWDRWAGKSMKYHGGTAAQWGHFAQSPPDRTGKGALVERARRSAPGFRLPSWGSEPAGQARDATLEPPRPLMRAEEPPTPYPVEELGELLGGAARAIHDKVQAPLAICGTSVLAAATQAAQPFADVVLPTGQRRPLSGYYVSVAGTGERKTSTDHEALAPVEERERELRATHEADLAAHDDALAAWKAERQAILADRKLKGRAAKEGALKDLGAEPAAPLVPMLTAPEPTYEGLCRLLATGHPSVGVFSAEGGQFIGGHAMSAENKLKTAAALSDLWDRGLVKRLRAGDGAQILPGRRVSLHLMAQPGVAERLLDDPVLADQGLLSRLLVTAPETMAGRRPWRDPKPESDTALTTYREHLLAMLRRALPLAVDQRTGLGKPNELCPRELPLSSEARDRWVEWADHCDAAMAPGGDLEPVRAHANKLPEQAARVAGVLALVDDLDCTGISRAQLERAIELVKHHAAEAARLARAGAVAGDLRLAQRLLEWLTTSWGEPVVSLPDIYQRSLNAIGDKATAARIVGILADHGWLTKIEGGAEVAGVRRRDAWAIHGKGAAA